MACYASGVARSALYHVRVKSALYEKLGVLYTRSFLFEGADELFADDLALRLRVGDACKLIQEAPLGLDVDQGDVRVLPKRLDDLLGLVLT